MTRKRQAHGDGGPMIFNDALLRTLLVVEHRGELWLCPRRPGGWSARSKVTMTDAARSERLTPAHDITPAWLGIDGEKQAPGMPLESTQTRNHDQSIGPQAAATGTRS